MVSRTEGRRPGRLPESIGRPGLRRGRRRSGWEGSAAARENEHQGTTFYTGDRLLQVSKDGWSRQGWKLLLCGLLVLAGVGAGRPAEAKKAAAPKFYDG